MTRYWIAPDGDREPTLWVAESEEPSLMDHSHPRAVARRCDTPPELWALAVLMVGPFCPPAVGATMREAIRVELDLRRAAGRGA